MSIIGIIASEKQANQMRKEIKEALEKELISINYKSIENIKNVKFEIVIIQELQGKLKEKQEYLKELLKETKYLLLNADITINEEVFEGVNVKILTYGLKQKATVTVSSIEENQIIISIQRAFKNIKGKMISQQEIPINLKKKNSKYLYNYLVKVAIINLFSSKNR